MAEFIGAFALVFFGCGAIAVGLHPTAVAVAFGLVIAVMVAALGHISGAHFNPAVSVAFGVGRHVPAARVAVFIVAQVTGAIAGALVLRVTLGSGADLGVTHPVGSALQAFAWEAILTFFLMLVIAAVATDDRAGRQLAALAIGGTVALGALVGGPVSGASMNPARSMGPALVAGDLADLWIYLVAPVLGAVVAILVYEVLRSSRGSRGPSPRIRGSLPSSSRRRIRTTIARSR